MHVCLFYSENRSHFLSAKCCLIMIYYFLNTYHTSSLLISSCFVGRLANKQLKSHFRAYEAMQLDAHFDERDLKFKQMEVDPVTGE